MIDHSLLRSLLSHDFYNSVKTKLSPELFSEDCAELYEALAQSHDRYEHDLSPDELKLAWRQANPVATRAEVNLIADLVDDLREADPISPDMAEDAVTALYRRDVGRKIAVLGLDLAEGKDAALAGLQTLLEASADGFVSDDFGDPTTDDLRVLLAETGDKARFPFNIATLRNRVYGIGPQEFAIAFGVPNSGKTALVVSLAGAPDGWIDQGKRVLFLGNEEATARTMVRAYSTVTGMSLLDIDADMDKAMAIFRAKTKGRMLFKDTQDWDLEKIEAYIAKMKPDIVVIDQADKVQIRGRFEAGHERLRELYRRLRETAKKYKCALIGVSQASADAGGRTKLSYMMMEGSKIGKAAEADLIIGIGINTGPEDENDPTRYLTISKNKLNGWHGTIVCQIQSEISRYVE